MTDQPGSSGRVSSPDTIHVQRAGCGRWSLTLTYTAEVGAIPQPPRDLGTVWGKWRATRKAIRRADRMNASVTR